MYSQVLHRWKNYFGEFDESRIALSGECKWGNKCIASITILTFLHSNTQICRDGECVATTAPPTVSTTVPSTIHEVTINPQIGQIQSIHLQVMQANIFNQTYTQLSAAACVETTGWHVSFNVLKVSIYNVFDCFSFIASISLCILFSRTLYYP